MTLSKKESVVLDVFKRKLSVASHFVSDPDAGPYQGAYDALCHREVLDAICDIAASMKPEFDCDVFYAVRNALAEHIEKVNQRIGR